MSVADLIYIRELNKTSSILQAVWRDLISIQGHISAPVAAIYELDALVPYLVDYYSPIWLMDNVIMNLALGMKVTAWYFSTCNLTY